MGISSNVAVGSLATRFGAVLVATLLMAVFVGGTGSAGSRLLAADGTVVVAQDGSGSVETIAEAVAMANDGDTILIRPGTYTEALVIDKEVTLTGSGPVGEVVIRAPEDGPTTSTGLLDFAFRSDVHPYAILLVDSDATLAGLTFRGSRSAVVASGGSPTLERLRFDGPRDLEVFPRGYREELAIIIKDGSTATLRDSTLLESASIGVFDRSEPRILDNTLEGGGASILGGFGDAAIVEGNTFTGTGGREDRHEAPVIGVFDPSTMTIADNQILATDDAGILIGSTFLPEGGFDPIVRGNRISGALTGIHVKAGAEPLLEGNELIDNEIAIVLARSDAALKSNVISGGNAGIVIGGGSPVLEANTVEGAGRGIVIGGGASPSLIGNIVCGNATNLFVREGEETPDTTSNEICADEPAETSE